MEKIGIGWMGGTIRKGMVLALLGAVVLILAGRTGTGASAENSPLDRLMAEGDLIAAKKVEGSVPKDPTDPVWKTVSPLTIHLYPQLTTFPNTGKFEAMPVSVSAVYGNDELALLLQWSDEKETRLASEDPVTDFFPDAAAVQFPLSYGAGQKLPYIGMGEPSHPVNLWFWNSREWNQAILAGGFGSGVKLKSGIPTAKGTWDKGKWSVVFSRSLKAEEPKAVQFSPGESALVPVSFAVWNGDDKQRNGRKVLGSWRLLRFEKGTADPKYAQEFLWSPPVQGDPKTGEKLMKERRCVSCHYYEGPPEGRPKLGPALTFAGGIHRPQYLLESIQDPNGVVIPDKRFYKISKDGHVSKMPKIKFKDPNEVYHIVEYLRTRK